MTDQIEAALQAQTNKPTKAAIVSKLLSRPRGASLGDICRRQVAVRLTAPILDLQMAVRCRVAFNKPS